MSPYKLGWAVPAARIAIDLDRVAMIAGADVGPENRISLRLSEQGKLGRLKIGDKNGKGLEMPLQSTMYVRQNHLQSFCDLRLRRRGPFFRGADRRGGLAAGLP